jgi:hypothetical protein
MTRYLLPAALAAALMTSPSAETLAQSGPGGQFFALGASVDAQARYRWLENFCRSHPLDCLLLAALALRQDLIVKGR